jgi:serine/threonine protein kinase
MDDINHFSEVTLPLKDFDENDDFVYSYNERCRIYNSRLRIYDDGRKHYPDGTTQDPPEGCWMRYYAEEGNVPYTKPSIDSSLGAGAYGKVDVVWATHIPEVQGHREFARKEYHDKETSNSPRKSKAQEALESEITIYNKLEKAQTTNHRVKIFDAYTIGMKRFFLIMDPVAKSGTLKRLIFNFVFAGENRTAEEARTLHRAIGCLTVAMARLHEKGFRHRDLHPDNVLLHEGNILVCDFGASLHAEYEQRSTTTTDFPPKMERYAAPEVISAAGKRNKMADVFSLGAILFEIVFALHGRRELMESWPDGGYRYEARIDEVRRLCDPSTSHIEELWYISQTLRREQHQRIPARILAAQLLNLPKSERGPRMCEECQEWLDQTGEPQKLRDELREKRERFRKQEELQERRERRENLQKLTVKRTRSFEF